MPTPLPWMPEEEYRALRATIRERGTVRHVLALATLAGWAAALLAGWASTTVAAVTLIPLLLLATGFEIVFALHVGAERIGRYIEIVYEAPPDGRPHWERLMRDWAGEQPQGPTTDPLFVVPFLIAVLLNFLVAALLTPAGGPSLPPGIPAELAGYGVFHLIAAGRILRARQLAGRQRAADRETIRRWRNRVDAEIQAIGVNNSTRPSQGDTLGPSL